MKIFNDDINLFPLGLCHTGQQHHSSLPHPTLRPCPCACFDLSITLVLDGDEWSVVSSSASLETSDKRKVFYLCCISNYNFSVVQQLYALHHLGFQNKLKLIKKLAIVWSETFKLPYFEVLRNFSV
jgi:hypothetical protein